MSDRSNSVWTPRHIVAAFAVVLFTALIAAWSSLPARAGQRSAAPQSSHAMQHRLAVRTGTGLSTRVAARDGERWPEFAAASGRRPRRLSAAQGCDRQRRDTTRASLACDARIKRHPRRPSRPTSTASHFLILKCGPIANLPTRKWRRGRQYHRSDQHRRKSLRQERHEPGTLSISTVFSNVDPTIFSSDPRIEYDTLAGRWYISFLILDTTDIATAQKWILRAGGLDRLESGRRLQHLCG